MQSNNNQNIEQSNAQLVIASTNPGKIQDFKHSLSGMPIHVLSINDLDNRDFLLSNFPPENGLTFADNALGKARYLYRNTRQAVLADDSGLVLPGLGGAPGVKSARWGDDLPDGHTFAVKMNLVWQQICTAKAENGYAIFVCSLAFVHGEQEKIFHGELLGKLVSPAQHKSDKHGFGYDAIFMPMGYKKTFSEMSPVIKRQISHRALAVNLFKKWWQADFV